MKKVLLTGYLLLLLPFVGLAQATVGLTQPNMGGFGGYSLVAPNGAKDTYLIDACGQVVRKWQSNNNPGLVAYLLEDGSLLRACRIPGQSGAIGGGLVERRDWNDSLIWSYYHTGSTYRQHHDIRMMPNGHVLLLARESKSAADCIARGRNPALLVNNGLIMEYIVEVAPIGADSGAIVWEWHLWDHLIQDFDSTKAGFGVVADHPELLDINASTTTAPDWIHSNAVCYNPALDQLIMNSRNQNEFWIIDHNTTTAEAGSHAGGAHGRGGDFLYRWGNPANYDRGTVADRQLWLQHDAHWIEPGLAGAGQIMIFNNGDGRPAGQYSTVITIEPPVDGQGDYALSPGQAWGPAQPAWSYQAPNPTDFYAFNVSGAQRLPNGNTHICEGSKGRLFEIDTLGNIVWEYIVPLSSGVPISQGTAPSANATFRSYRYDASYPGLAGRDLTPGDRIELNPLPLPADCNVAAQAPAFTEAIRIAPNPFGDHLRLDAALGSRYQVLDALGHTVHSGEVTVTPCSLDLAHLSQGMYLLQVATPAGHVVTRIVKQ
jgi:Arylsulfotransferase (ASST)